MYKYINTYMYRSVMKAQLSSAEVKVTHTYMYMYNYIYTYISIYTYMHTYTSAWWRRSWARPRSKLLWRQAHWHHRMANCRQMRYAKCVKRDPYTSKETHIRQKRPIYVKRGIQNRPTKGTCWQSTHRHHCKANRRHANCVKRDPYTLKNTYKRDLQHKWDLLIIKTLALLQGK